MPNSIVLSKYEARDFILDQTLQTRHRHHRMDPKMRRSALTQSRAHTQCCLKNNQLEKFQEFKRVLLAKIIF